MLDRPSADRTAELLLWYERKPSRYQTEGRRRDAPRLDSEVILKLALGRRVQFADATWNEPAKVDALQRTACAYVRQLFFRPDPTPYQVLGLEPGASPEAIKECFRLLMQLVHPDRQGEKKRWPDACAAQANWAHSMLRDQETRRTFEEDARARAGLARAINRAATAAEASRMPTLVRAKKWAKGGRSVAQPMLPEWLTAGVGGYVRQHPAATAYGALITVAALIIGASLWEAHDGSLIRVAREESSAVKAAAPTPMLVSDGSAAAAVRPADPAPPRSTIPPPAAPTAQSVAKVDPKPASDPAPVSVAVAPPVPLPVALPVPLPVATPVPPVNAEVEALFASFVDSYERGRLDAFAALFDEDADTNLRRGRTAIRGEYEELFRLSQWRRMQLTRISWRPIGDRAVAEGEITVKIGWRDGREVEQRVNVDMELVRRDGRVVIARLSHQPKNP